MARIISSPTVSLSDYAEALKASRAQATGVVSEKSVEIRVSVAGRLRDLWQSLLKRGWLW